MLKAYPKPGEYGGRLIREVIRFFKDQGMTLPLTSDILIAHSGGVDSTALTHLIVKYGRRIVAPSQILILHLNHGWRGAESDGDEDFVRNFAESRSIRFKAVRMDSPHSSRSPYLKSRSWEEVARTLRKEVFSSEAARVGGWVLTAHQKDDLAETVLWRLMTGAAETLGGGIALRHGVELRPLLNVRKQELVAYLNEESQAWRTDSSNLEERFLRARLRARVIPELESVFPKAVENLARLGLDAQARSETHGENKFTPELLIGSRKPKAPAR